MADDLRLTIEPLTRRHDRDGFSCGVPALDSYLKRMATQDDRRNLARCFVGVREGETSIIGYYTLSTLSIALDDLPADLSRRLPRYSDIPAALIGRLACDARYHRQGLGGVLLADALSRLLQVSERVAVHAVVVEAKDDAAAAFYARFGFRPQASRLLRLFLPLATAAAALRDPA